MGLTQNSYAKVWSVKQNGKIYSGRISVSKKNKDTGEYTSLFTGFVNFAGEAARKAVELGLPEIMNKENPISRSIQIKSAPDISTWYNKAKADELINLANGNEKLINFIKANSDSKTITIWDFEVAEDYSNNNKSTAKTSKAKTKKDIPDDEQENDLPF